MRTTTSSFILDDNSLELQLPHYQDHPLADDLGAEQPVPRQPSTRMLCPPQRQLFLKAKHPAQLPPSLRSLHTPPRKSSMESLSPVRLSIHWKSRSRNGGMRVSTAIRSSDSSAFFNSFSSKNLHLSFSSEISSCSRMIRQAHVRLYSLFNFITISVSLLIL